MTMKKMIRYAKTIKNRFQPLSFFGHHNHVRMLRPNKCGQRTTSRSQIGH